MDLAGLPALAFGRGFTALAISWSLDRVFAGGSGAPYIDRLVHFTRDIRRIVTC